MKKKKHLRIKHVLIGLIAIFIALLSFTAGDMFLSFLGKRLYIDIHYRNHAGFISCFILRSMRLENPVFMVKDFDFALGAEEACIKPDFRKMIKERAIVLRCTLENASFLTLGEKLGNNHDLFNLLGENLSALSDELGNILYETMDAELLIYTDKVRLTSCEANSKYLKLRASGVVGKKGDMDVKAQIFFSPEIASHFPNGLSGILTEESKGWLSYALHIKRVQDKSFLKLESDKFKLDFERVESK